MRYRMSDRLARHAIIAVVATTICGIFAVRSKAQTAEISADSVYVQARGYYDAGKYDKAAKAFETLLEMDKAADAEDLALHSLDMQWVASSYYKKGDVKNARKYERSYYELEGIDRFAYQPALECNRNALAATTPDIALFWFRECLNEEKKLFGDNHYMVYGSYCNMAEMSYQVGDSTECRKYIQLAKQCSDNIKTTTTAWRAMPYVMEAMLEGTLGHSDVAEPALLRAGELLGDDFHAVPTVYAYYLNLYARYRANDASKDELNEKVARMVAEIKDVDKDKIGEYLDLVRAISGYSADFNQPSLAIDMTMDVIGQIGEEHQYYPYLLYDLGRMYMAKGEMEKAIECFKNSLDITRSAYPKEPSQWVDGVFNLGEAYLLARDYDKARECFEETRTICKNLGGQGISGMVQSLHKLAALSTKVNEYKNAVKYLDEILKQMRKQNISVTDAPGDYAFIYKEMGHCYQNIDKAKALEYYQEAIALLEGRGYTDYDDVYIESVLNELTLEKADDDRVDETLERLIGMQTPGTHYEVYSKIKILSYGVNHYSAKFKYKRAGEYIDKAIEVADRMPDYDKSEIYSQRCYLYLMQGETDMAFALADSMYESTLKDYGRNSYQHAMAVILLVNLNDRVGDISRMKRSQEYEAEMLEIAQSLDPKDPLRFDLNIKAAKAVSISNPSRATEILHNALKETPQSVLNTNNTLQLNAYLLLSNIARNQGQLEDALQYGTVMKELIREDDAPIILVTLYDEMAQTLIMYDRFRDAEELLLKAEQLIEGNPEVGMEAYFLYAHLSNLYTKLGQFDLASKYKIRSSGNISTFQDNEMFGIKDKLDMLWVNYDLGRTEQCYNDIKEIEEYIANHEGFLNASMPLTLWGAWYMHEGDYDRAAEHIEKSLSMNANMDNLSLACEIYSAKGDYDKALKYANDYIDLLDNSYGRATLDHLPVYYRRGEIYSSLNDYEHGLDQYKKCVDISVDYISRNVLTLTSKQRADFWKTASPLFNVFLPQIAASGQYPESVRGLLYDATLFSSGLLLSADQSINSIVSRGSKQLKDAYEDYVSHKMILTKLTDDFNKLWQIGSSRDMDAYAKKEEELRAYQAECDATERSLMDMINAQYSDMLSYKTYRWQDVKKNLPAKSAAIEYLDFPVKGDEDHGTLAALVIKKDMALPELRILCQYPKGHKYTIEELYKTRAMGDSVIGSLHDLLADCEKVYFATQGVLSTISVGSLPVSEDKIVPGLKLYRVSSTRVLADKKKRRKNYDATLFGGLNYDASVDYMMADAEKYPELRNRAFVSDNFFRADREGDVEIAPLPGTLTEVNQIVDLLTGRKQKTPTLKVGNDGTESAFKAYSGRYGSILHVSTHGFYNAGGIVDNPNISTLTYEDLALEQSGLLMAGAANRYVDEMEIPDNLDDGILKSSEIAKLDMSDVDLAVLSACETGLGAVTGDGVMGLQRGFKKAGVNSILMSLWKVDDEATCALMSEFYRNWLSGKSKYESLEMAKNAIRSQEKWRDPMFWAAFILLDAIND